MRKFSFLLALLLLLQIPIFAQLGKRKTTFTLSDTLRGSLNAQRNWWNVIHYAVSVEPDFKSKTIKGNTEITFKTTASGNALQIDLQKPLLIDSIVYLNSKLKFEKTDTNAWIVTFPNEKKLTINNSYSIKIHYHGTPKEARFPPWDGGWIWKTDKNDQPWMSVACQGLGASCWYPCKDHQSDEPDSGATLSIIVPDSLNAIANGKLVKESKSNGKATYTWHVVNPINSYNLVPYIGKYTHFSDTLNGAKGKLELDYWVLSYNLEKAKEHFTQVKSMLRCFEYWFGPYPFYEDSYKLVEAPHLGMEHQSAVAYGNKYLNGYLGTDLSGTGWGKKWDFIIVHESGHEWFANNITTNDIADMWVHEGFTNYSESIYTEWLFGKKAGYEYNQGSRRGIRNDRPIIGSYGVNSEGSGDMYNKASNMIHMIRNSMNNDTKFRNMLIEMNKTFYHSTVDGKTIEDFMVKYSGINLKPLFDQYLRTTQIPVLRYYFSDDKKFIYLKWENCIDGFQFPLTLTNEKISTTITPTTKWQMLELAADLKSLFNEELILFYYYITLKEKAPEKGQ